MGGWNIDLVSQLAVERGMQLHRFFCLEINPPHHFICRLVSETLQYLLTNN